MIRRWWAALRTAVRRPAAETPIRGWLDYRG